MAPLLHASIRLRPEFLTGLLAIVLSSAVEVNELVGTRCSNCYMPNGGSVCVSDADPSQSCVACEKNPGHFHCPHGLCIGNPCRDRTVAPTVECSGGLVIPYSDRGVGNPCTGGIGAECEYKCDDGYMPIGKHICQHDEAAGIIYVNHSFFGGRCVALTGAHNCHGAGAKPVRIGSDNGSESFRTECFNSEDALLRQLARGNYEAWRGTRNNKTGIYIDKTDLTKPVQTGWGMGSSGVTGLGLIVEVIADEMGWETRSNVQERVLLTLKSLAGETPRCNIPRDPRGFFVHWFNAITCEVSADTSCLMCSGLLMAGALFTKNYYSKEDPSSEATKEIARLVDKLWDSMQFDKILCANGRASANGTDIPMVMNMHDDGCGPAKPVLGDGMYNFNEEHYTVWFAYEKACPLQKTGECPNVAIQQMWDRWMSRSQHPNYNYKEHPLLSLWSGYIVHLPFYTSHSFNSNADFQALFKSHWRADMEYYNDVYYSGERGRYGLGAGPTERSCADNSGYVADRIATDPKHQSKCRNLSPYIVAGYLPAAREQITAQLMDLLSDGETVLPVAGTDYFVLWRKSMLDSSWEGAGSDVTMVDFSSEIFGLATLWLGVDFFQSHSDHFVHNSVDELFV